MTLHVRDHGGGGVPLILVHGAGRSLADWDIAAAHLLEAGYRVLAIDLPGHGRSPDIAPWSVHTVVERIAEALEVHGVVEPVVVGHSLGGLVAVEYARARTVRAVVNLDGFWWGRPGEYPDAERLGALMRSAAGAIAASEHIAEEVALAARYGIPAEIAEPAARAAVRPLPDGRWQTLPQRAAALQMYDELDRLGALGVTAWLADIECPLLLVQAQRQPSRSIAWLDALFTTFARGLAIELAALARVRASISVTRIGATHAMVLEAPGSVAALIAEFVHTLPGNPT